MSHDIVNEMVLLIHKRNLIVNIQEAQWFSIIADETRDVSNQEQLVVTIRWVDKMYDIHEDVVGIINVVSTTADSITITIKRLLESCNLSLSNCRGQTYDGAANMMGCMRVVAEQLKKLHPLAVKYTV